MSSSPKSQAHEHIGLDPLLLRRFPISKHCRHRPDRYGPVVTPRPDMAALPGGQAGFIG